MDIKNDIKSAFIHKNIVKELYNKNYENKSSLSIVYEIEDLIKSKCNIAFPVGIGLNECIAHNTPLNHNEIIKNGDLIKIDFGTHIEGHITDSAFTIGVNTSKFDDLINISKRATMIGVENSGVDVLLSEIGEKIEEYICSKEVEINNTLYKVKNIKELCGHSISPYIIHSGKAVPNCKLDFPYNIRMKVGEKYAIEPFVTTGNGICIYDNNHNNHFMLKDNIQTIYKKELLNKYNMINAYYKSLPFTQRWLYENNDLIEKYYNKNSDYYNIINNDLNILYNEKLLNIYPPIYDIKGSYVAQHEHNIMILESGILLLTKNNYF